MRAIPTTHVDIDTEFLRIVDELTRRGFLTGAAGVAALAGLAACGSSEDESTGPSKQVTFSYRGVTVDVPRNPKRVAVIEGRGDLDFALLAGYPIVACGPGLTDNAQASLPGLQFAGLLDSDVTPLKLVGGAELNIEQLASTEPDLLVMRANAYEGEFYGPNTTLHQIAPILPIEVNTGDFHGASVDQLAQVGRTESMKTWLSRYQAKIADGKKRLGSVMVGKKVAMMAGAADYVLVWTNTIGISVAADLGWDVLFADPHDEDGAFKISPENFGRLKPADLIFEQNKATAGTPATWKRLPAVVAGRVIDYPAAYNNGLLITACAIVDFLVESATEAFGSR